MTINPYYIIKRPIVTEESIIQRDTKNQYVFRVEAKANKHQIRDAIELLFKVKVVSVNTIRYQGKLSGRRGRSLPGHRPDWKKAIITLRQGDTIELI